MPVCFYFSYNWTKPHLFLQYIFPFFKFQISNSKMFNTRQFLTPSFQLAGQHSTQPYLNGHSSKILKLNENKTRKNCHSQVEIGSTAKLIPLLLTSPIFEFPSYFVKEKGFFNSKQVEREIQQLYDDTLQIQQVSHRQTGRTSLILAVRFVEFGLNLSTFSVL